MSRRKIYKGCQVKYGDNAQLLKLAEECGELVQAVCKTINGQDHMSSIAEEIADVEIMCEQIKFVHCLTARVEINRDNKLKKMEGRLDLK